MRSKDLLSPEHKPGNQASVKPSLAHGLAACQAEWRLITATHNLLKLWRTTPVTA
jgi:hypothetical protein